MSADGEAVHVELAVAAKTLDALTALVGATEKAEPAVSTHRAGHLRYPWVVIGSRLKNYCEQRHITRAGGEFGNAIGLRHKLAYSDPDEIDDRVVEAAARDDAPRRRTEIAAALDALR